MRVPRPPAMITVARYRVMSSEIAGAPGFEPGIAGPKPAALPLGYAPPRCHFYPSSGFRRPRGQSPHGLFARRCEQRLSTWLRPTTLSFLPKLGLDGRAGKAPISVPRLPKDRDNTALATPNASPESLAPTHKV